ncbi:hypothetical protein FB451DRAFT_1275158 [Mycena latifolia]|nr:hypothetical protein FB451DRAFT_1275158 [Mycena latifolia]
MSSSLPPGLWDFTISRLCPRPTSVRMGRLGFAHSARNNAHAALAKAPSPPPSAPFPLAPAPTGDYRGTLGRSRRTTKQPGPLTPRSGRPATGPIAEIERRVNALKEAADVEVLATEKLVFSEDALLAMYEDLLAHHPADLVPAVADEPAQADKDISTVRELEQQLLGMKWDSSTPDTPFITKLRRESGQSFPTFDEPVVDKTAALHLRVLQLANARFDRLDALQRMQPSSSTSVPPPLPIPLFSMEEYRALSRACVNEGDFDAAESVLHLMKRSGLVIPEEPLTAVLRRHTEAGDVHKAEHCLATFLTGAPTEPQRHLHVKCHLTATPRDHVPESALAVLHSYEAQGHPAPMKTYTSTIAALYSTHLSIARAQAWDLFAHMRYVAHPAPDVVLYTAMIRACASPVGTARSADPERALDLWTEMTVEHKLTPTVGSYNAVILACAKSGRKMYVNEAFRIAKEMLDAHRDAYGRSAYMPDRQTLCALLEGAKRIGDLARARWILADLVRSDAAEADGVDEEIMMHVFHTYTSYVPPFTRNLAMLVPGRESKTPAAASDAPATQAADQPTVANTPPPTGHSSRFTRVPPQTSHEVIEEVQALFQRILEDTGKDQSGPAHAEDLFPGQTRFQHVKINVRLVNSYLSAHYQHSSLETSAALFWSVFNNVGLVPDARSCVDALERCGRAKRGRDRTIGLQFAERLWAEWQTLEDAGRASARPVDARMVERAHAAYIRVLTLNGQLERAMDHVKAFASCYPPSHLFEYAPKASFRSTRTVLEGARPLVRLMSTTEVPDDSVPPLLMFEDLEILHHRLVAASMTAGIGYIKYLSKAYEWALRGRRDAAMKARPPPATHAIATADWSVDP